MRRIPRTMFACCCSPRSERRSHRPPRPAARASRRRSRRRRHSPRSPARGRTARAGRRELEVEIEHARALAGRRLMVFVGGTRIGTMLVGKLGTPRLTAPPSSARPCRMSLPARASVHTAAGATVAKGRF